MYTSSSSSMAFHRAKMSAGLFSRQAISMVWDFAEDESPVLNLLLKTGWLIIELESPRVIEQLPSDDTNFSKSLPDRCSDN